MKNIAGFALLLCMAACSKEEFEEFETPEPTEPTELIAFTRPTSHEDESLKIHVMHPDGSHVRSLNTVAHYDIAWSPDGRKIAYSNDGIHTLNLHDFKVSRVVDSGGDAFQPAWSPDGSHLAFVANGNFSIPSGSSFPGIFIASLNGRFITNPVFDSLMLIDFDPAWSPDGKKIAFSSVRAYVWDYTETNSDIYIMNPDGTEVTRLTESPDEEAHPVWSPDGKKIAFDGNRSGNNSWSIYVMNADGSDLFQVTHNLSQSGHSPTWSPDGSWLAFVSDHDGNNEIYVINIDGTGMKRLTDDPREDLYPAWSPISN